MRIMFRIRNLKVWFYPLRRLFRQGNCSNKPGNRDRSGAKTGGAEMKRVSDILTSKQYLQGRFFGSGVTRETVLGQCFHNKSAYTLKIIPTNRPNDPYFPKFIPQIKQSCSDCGKYLKFATQSPELINRVNKILREVPIYG